MKDIMELMLDLLYGVNVQIEEGNEQSNHLTQWVSAGIIRVKPIIPDNFCDIFDEILEWF